MKISEAETRVCNMVQHAMQLLIPITSPKWTDAGQLRFGGAKEFFRGGVLSAFLPSTCYNSEAL